MFGKRSGLSNELAPPPVARSGAGAVEIARIWAVPGGGQELTLQPAWKDPGAWGLMLVDLANHVANAYASQGHDRDQVLARMWQLFDAERANPTDKAEPL